MRMWALQHMPQQHCEFRNSCDHLSYLLAPSNMSSPVEPTVCEKRQRPWPVLHGHDIAHSFPLLLILCLPVTMFSLCAILYFLHAYVTS
jgi:hypothetical protein